MYFYRPQRSCGKVMFSQACVKNSVPACTTCHMTRGSLQGVSVQGVSVRGIEGLLFKGCLSRGLCPVTSLSRGVSVQGILYLGGLCLGGVCPGESLSRGLGSLSRGLGSLSRGSMLGRPRWTEPSPLYGNERAVRILLECILLYQQFPNKDFFCNK